MKIIYANTSEILKDNYVWYKDRLSDSTLLDLAVPVPPNNPFDYAVPICGARKGGWLTFHTKKDRNETYKLLLKRWGFPNLKKGKRDGQPSLSWGFILEPTGIYDRGIWHGFKPELVKAFVEEMDGPMYE